MFARKHVSIISVSIAPSALALIEAGIYCRKVDRLYGLRPQMPYGIRLIKKPSGERRSNGLIVLLRLCPSFRILAFRFAPPYS